jgi:hypothetical protein
VTDAQTPSIPPSLPPTLPAGQFAQQPPTAPPIITPGYDAVQMMPPPVSAVEVLDAPKKQSKGKWILAAAGVLAIGGVAVIATRAVGGSSAGAESPEAAVDAMLGSVSGEDPVAMVNSMAPSEMRTLGSVTQRGMDQLVGDTDQAKQLRDVGIDLDADDLVPGLTIDFTNTKYDVDELAGDVAKVTFEELDGEWSFDPEAFLDHVDLEKLADGWISEDEFVDEFAGAGGEFSIDDLRLPGGDDMFVMAVEENGDWFISPTFTLLEYIRVDGDFPEPDFSAPEGKGAATPEEAVEQMVDALFNEDVDAVIDALPPSKYRALYAYREMLVELAGESSNTDVAVTVGEVKEFDDSQGVGVEIIAAEAEVDGSRIEIDGKCARADGDEICLDDLGEDAGPFADGIPGVDKFWVIETKEDGKYYVDPIGTVISYVSAVDDDKLTELIEQLED